jgi:predicted O-linked N-acetylglucosamine transferase (SPINDLY family)
LGVSDAVAADEDDYVALTVSIARDAAKRDAIKAKIASHIHKMWRSQDAVDHWTDVLLRLAHGSGPGSEL